MSLHCFPIDRTIRIMRVFFKMVTNLSEKKHEQAWNCVILPKYFLHSVKHSEKQEFEESCSSTFYFKKICS